MRTPIKLNNSFWPVILTRYLPSSDDPSVLLDEDISGDDFSQAVSVFKFGTTFKTTKGNRFPRTVEALASLDWPSPPTILDVGASDGLASLHVAQNLVFKKYFITDLNTEVLLGTRDGRSCFYNSDRECILIVTKMFVIYSDFEDAILPFNIIAKSVLSHSRDAPEQLKKIELVNPEILKLKGDIEFTRYDIFERWPGEKVDLIIAANIINRCYFPDSQILRSVRNLASALRIGGRLVVVDNREIEKATIFRFMDRKTVPEVDIHGGTEIRDLILNNPIA